MDNPIKKYIDALKKKRVKELNKDLPASEKNRQKQYLEEKYEYGNWFRQTFSIENCMAPFPRNSDELEIYDFFSLEIFYKQSFKSLCDKDHPVIFELLENLNFSSQDISSYIYKTKLVNYEFLQYYLLFKDELIEGDFGLEKIQSKVDDLANDCSQGVIISHSVKMTNPDCKFPRLMCISSSKNDGYLRTGNSKVDFDMHINAAKLKIFKFLSLKYKGFSILENIKKGNEVFQNIFQVDDDCSTKWRELFLSCISVSQNKDVKTDGRIKQIYFPTENGYHLLSLLQPSGLVFFLKERIDERNVRSPEAYLGKKQKKSNKYSDKDYSSISNITVTKHGGDHPKNISGLNNKYQTYYLLSSVPPVIEKSSLRFPKDNFFINSLYKSDYADVFHALHKILKTDYNNINIREGRDYRIQALMDRIIDKMWAVRSITDTQHYDSSKLKPYQRIWLDNFYKDERENSDEWLNELTQEISAWTIRAYGKIIGRQAIKLGEEERKQILKIVQNNKEALR